MFNSTILSLNVLTMASSSPFLTLPSTNQRCLSTSFYNFHISNSFASTIISFSSIQQLFLNKCSFSHSLDSAIKLSNTCSTFENNVIENEKISQRKSYQNSCGNISLIDCTFDGCSSTDNGGSLYIHQEYNVIIHGTIFKNSYTSSKMGGAGYIVASKKENGKNYADDMIPQLDVQYCCFYDCYSTGTELYGAALFSAAKKTILFYTSSVNCPGQSHNEAEGAQFDLQSNNVSSQQVNTTNGNSKYCGAIEYRHSTSGYFRHETITNIACMFGIAYTNVAVNVALELSNMVNITLSRKQGEGMQNVYSGLIHVRKLNEIKISNFCFMDNNFGNDQNDHPKIVSRGANDDGSIQSIKVILNNCYYDCTDDFVGVTDNNAENNIKNNCVPETKTLNHIEQLDLGDCKGAVTPPPFVPIVPTDEFSRSKDFTKSDEFSRSKDFTKSDEFSKSGLFSDSKKFTKSDNFDRSSKFTKSDVFTRSSYFTKSDPFSKSNDFTLSGSFSFPIVPRDESNENKKSNTGMIAGVTVAAVAAVAIAAIAAFFIIKKKRGLPHFDEDVETIDDSSKSVNNANPIYDANANDDPFQEDFDK